MEEKLILFDWEGVIMHKYPSQNNSKEAVVNAIKAFNNNLSDDEAYDIYRASLKDENDIYVSQYNDKENLLKWYERLEEKANLSLKDNEIYNNREEAFYKKFEEEYLKTDYYKDVVELIHSLKGKCKVGVFSDLILYCDSALDKQVAFDTLDYIFLSHEIHYLKTDERAFRYVERMTGIKPNNILFIDDNGFNIEVARKCGWNAYIAQGFEIEKIRKIVEDFLT